MCFLGKTAELIDAEGYVLSGDLGRFDKEYIVFYCNRVDNGVIFYISLHSSAVGRELT